MMAYGCMATLAQRVRRTSLLERRDADVVPHVLRGWNAGPASDAASIAENLLSCSWLIHVDIGVLEVMCFQCVLFPEC